MVTIRHAGLGGGLVLDSSIRSSALLRSNGSLAHKLVTGPFFLAHRALFRLLHSKEVPNAVIMQTTGAITVATTLALAVGG